MGQTLTNSKTLVSIYVEIVSKCLLRLQLINVELCLGWSSWSSFLLKYSYSWIFSSSKNMICKSEWIISLCFQLKGSCKFYSEKKTMKNRCPKLDGFTIASFVAPLETNWRHNCILGIWHSTASWMGFYFW